MGMVVMNATSHCPENATVENPAMAFSRSVFEKPPAKLGKGRPKKTPPPSIYLLAMDFLKPGSVKRRVRFQACLEHINAQRSTGRATTQTSLAKTLNVEERNLIAYIQGHKKRSGVVTTAHRQRLAKILCGNPACEPWLSDGTWSLPNKTVIAPPWLIDAGIVDKTKSFVRWMTLAYYRCCVSGKDASVIMPPLALDYLCYTGGAWTLAYGDAKAWSPAWWELRSVELAATDAETKAAFAVFLAAMKSSKIWHRDLGAYLPAEVARADEAFKKEQLRKATGASGLPKSPSRGPQRQRPTLQKSHR
jgi:hypothetical protein